MARSISVWSLGGELAPESSRGREFRETGPRVVADGCWLVFDMRAESVAAGQRDPAIEASSEQDSKQSSVMIVNVQVGLIRGRLARAGIEVLDRSAFGAWREK